MKRRGERRRRGILHSLFFADPYRKLVAIGLAIGLWYFLDNQISADSQLILNLRAVEEDDRSVDDAGGQLQVQFPPRRWTPVRFENAFTDEQITSVTLQFRGPKNLIERLANDTSTFVAHDPGEGNLEEQGGFEFSFNHINVFPLDFEGLLVSMTPSRVKMVLEINRDFPVSLSVDRVDFTPPRDVGDQRILYDQAAWSTPEVTLYGPEADVQALPNTQKLFEVELEERQGNDQVTGNLILVDQFSHFEMNPPSLRVTIPLQPEPDLYLLTVPISVDDQALLPGRRGRYTSDVPDMEITLEASGRLRDLLNSKAPERQQEWATEFMRLYVRLEPGFGVGSGQNLPLKVAKLIIPAPEEEIDPGDYRLRRGAEVTVTITERDRE